MINVFPLILITFSVFCFKKMSILLKLVKTVNKDVIGFTFKDRGGLHISLIQDFGKNFS